MNRLPSGVEMIAYVLMMVGLVVVVSVAGGLVVSVASWLFTEVLPVTMQQVFSHLTAGAIGVLIGAYIVERENE